MQVRLFGSAAERAGARSLRVGPVRDVRELIESLRQQVPALGDLLPRCLVAVNRTYASPDTELREGDEVAIVPPVSGGEPFAVSESPLDPEPLRAAVTHAGAGAVVTFTGTVRARTGSLDTAELHYEAYAAMAEEHMRRIGQEAARRWPGCRVAAAHRVGRLLPGEAAVIVAASAPHRAAAFAACQFVIDAIKQDVPIWKKEVGPDGRSFWVEHA